MPVVLKLDDIMSERNIGLGELAEEVGITLANLSRIKTGKVKALRFSTLGKLCEALECKPGDIIDYLPEGGQGSDGVEAGDIERSSSDKSAIHH